MNRSPPTSPASDLPDARYDPALPITARREDIVAAIANHQVVVVAGETGSGKTTQLPRYCLDAGRGQQGLVGCTQPRRIAARAMASRVAEEMGCKLGEQVGYQVRFREQVSSRTVIKFMTDGILLAEATSDRMLRGYDTILIDEAHERSLNIDFLLGYLKRVLPRRPDLKVVITSATIDTAKFSRHFDDAPVIEVSGRGYPVDVIYQPMEEQGDDARRAERDLYKAIVTAVRKLDRVDPRGDVLVFLSGEREIHEARDALQRAGLRNTEVLPLYARLSGPEQQRVFHPGGARRIILATNVAETSLTVPRIRYVIDSGLARISRYSHRSRIQRLPIEPVSQASADQRKGRCGRIGPGTCIRLYSEIDFESREEFTEPEVLRTSLATVILRMLDMGLGAVEDFPFIDRPAPRMINDAYQMLFELGAVDAGRSLKPLGRRLARWPLDVRLARMIEAGVREGHLSDLLVLASGLSIQDPRERPALAQQQADEAHERFADQRSDFVSLLKLWAYLRKQRHQLSGNQFRKLCRREFLSWQRVLEWFDLYQQLRDQAREQKLSLSAGHADYEPLHRALLCALLSNVGQRDPEAHSYRGARNRSFHIFPGSGLFGHGPAWLMSAEIVETSKPYARMNAKVDPAWVEAQAGHLLKRHYYDPHFSRKRGQVMAWEQVSLFGLILVEKRRVSYQGIDPEASRTLFITHALARGELDPEAWRRRYGKAVDLLDFVQTNDEFRQELEVYEHKSRQRDVLADEQALLDFFDARLPDNVASVATLIQWLKTLDEPVRQRLHMGAEVLLRDPSRLPEQDQFPDQLELGGRYFALAYRFEPGHPHDGVSLKVPLHLLNTIEVGQIQWLVPGLLHERVLELMRTLPKPLRRALTPLPQFAQAAIGQLDEPGARPLESVLAEVVSRDSGVRVQPTDFKPEQLPLHLQMRIEVVDEHQQVVDEGRDLAVLQARHGSSARRRFMHQQGQGFNQDGLTEWSFGQLPECTEVEQGTPAWPALVDQGDAVGLRLFDTETEAWAMHGEGVLRLLALRLQQRLSELRRHPRVSKPAQLAWAAASSGLQDVAGLFEDLLTHSLYAAARPEPASVRGAQQFERLCEQTTKAVGAVFTRQAGVLEQVMTLVPKLHSRLDALGQVYPQAVTDMSESLDDLVYSGFLTELEEQRLRHYPRYLQAIGLRIEALEQDPQRDQRQSELIHPHWRRYCDWLEAGNGYGHELDRYRWLLAEYRVSVFAQRLGTAEKVSPQRLEKAWQDVLASEWQ